MKFGKKEKILLIVGISIMILIILIYIIINLINTKHEYQDLPFDTEDANVANKEINYIYNINKSNEIITNTDKNSNTYSLLITVKTKSELGNYFIPTYHSFIYSIKDNVVLSKEEIANLYNYTLDEIENKITERFRSWYNEESNLGYVDKNECDLDCYFSFHRNINNLNDSYTLFVKKNKLYVYISFDKNSYCDDLEFFDRLDYDPYVIEL